MALLDHIRRTSSFYSDSWWKQGKRRNRRQLKAVQLEELWDCCPGTSLSDPAVVHCPRVFSEIAWILLSRLMYIQKRRQKNSHNPKNRCPLRLEHFCQYWSVDRQMCYRGVRRMRRPTIWIKLSKLGMGFCKL
jgi:hypothetical protein